MYLEVAEYNYGIRTGLSAGQIAECKRWVNGAQSIYAGEYNWTFLSPQASMTLWADASGTCTGVKDNGTTTVTATTASFFASMVGHDIVIADVGTFTITSYTNSTVVVVSGDATGAAKAFTITADGRYSLPADCDSLKTDPTYSTATSAIGTLAEKSPEYIRHRHSATTVTGNPREYAVQPRTFDNTTGQRRELYVYPIPQSDRVVEYQYSVIQADMVNDTDMPLGGARHCWTIVAGALAFAEEKKHGGPGAEAKIYERRLANSKRRDDQQRSRNLGQNDNRGRPVGQAVLTFDGYG